MTTCILNWRCTRSSIGKVPLNTLMESAIYQVSAFWDAEAEVWVATSEDVPGLATEADTIERLSQRLRDIVPELLLSNHVISQDYVGAIAIQLTSHRQELVEVAS